MAMKPNVHVKVATARSKPGGAAKATSRRCSTRSAGRSSRKSCTASATHCGCRTNATERFAPFSSVASTPSSRWRCGPPPHPPIGLRPRPLLTVLLGDEAFSRLCELGNGTVIAPGQLVPYLSEADIERIVYDPPNRKVEASHRRSFVGALRADHPSARPPLPARVRVRRARLARATSTTSSHVARAARRATATAACCVRHTTASRRCATRSDNGTS